jgi:uncharacterized membrane protein (UPF0182 family)
LKGKRVTSSIVLTFLIIVAILASSINVIVDYQWFNELGYLPIYFTKLVAILKLMVPTFLVVFVVLILYYKS